MERRRGKQQVLSAARAHINHRTLQAAWNTWQLAGRQQSALAVRAGALYSASQNKFQSKLFHWWRQCTRVQVRLVSSYSYKQVQLGTAERVAVPQGCWKRCCSALSASSKNSAATTVVAHWRAASVAAQSFRTASMHCSHRLLFKGMMAWKLAHHICIRMHWQLQQADTLRTTLLCTNAFQSWLLFCAQRLRQQIASDAARLRHCRRSMENALAIWQEFVKQRKAMAARKLQSAAVFRHTYVMHVSLVSWNCWVCLGWRSWSTPQMWGIPDATSTERETSAEPATAREASESTNCCGSSQKHALTHMYVCLGVNHSRQGTA